MNAELLRRAGIDYDRGVKRFAGRAQLYEKALSKFPRDTAFPRLRAARAAGDGAGMFAAAHELKGVCGNIAMPALYEAAAALVELLRAGAYAESALAAAYARLEREYHTVYGAICAAMEDPT